MYRYPNPTHYVNALGRKARQARGRGKLQQRGKPKRGASKPKRGRRMRDEVQPGYLVGPDGRLYLASGAGYHAAQQPQRLQGQPRPGRGRQNVRLRGGLQQYVKTDDNRILYVHKVKGVHVASKSNGKRPDRSKKVFNGPAIGPDNQVWIVNGGHIRPAHADEHQLVETYKARAAQQNVQGNKRSKKLPSDPHNAFGIIKSHMKTFVSWCKANPAPDFEVVKTGDEHEKVAKVLSQVSQFASDLMAGTGYFVGKRATYMGGTALKYIYYGKSISRLTEEGGVPSDKVPKYLREFDQAWHSADSGTSDHDKFCALKNFMSHLMGNVRHAIIFQHSYSVGTKQRDEMAHQVASKAGVEDTGNLRQNLEAAAAKLLRDQTLPSMKAGRVKYMIFKQVCVDVARASEKDHMSFGGLLEYCAQYQKSELLKYFNSHRVVFEEAAKKVRGILKSLEKRQSRRAHAPPAQQAVVPPAAPRVGMSLLPMRF